VVTYQISISNAVDGIAVSIILANCFSKFYLLIQDTANRLAVERKVLRTMFGGIKVNGNGCYTGVVTQSPGKPQPAVCQTACHAASVYTLYQPLELEVVELL
jgi:hypothetical protein